MTDETPQEATPQEATPQEATPEPASPPATGPSLPPGPASPVPPGPSSPLPGRVTAAGVVLLVFGTLAALGSAMTLLWSLVAVPRFAMRFDGGFMDPRMGGFPGGYDSGFMWGGLVFFGLAVMVGAAIAGGHIAAGWAILRRLSWGRILGMVVSGVALVVLVLGVGGTLISVAALQDLWSEFGPRYAMDWFRSLMTATVTFGVLVSVGVGIAYTFVLWVLARHGDVFD